MLIVTALPEELAPLLARCRNRTRSGRSPDSFEALLGGTPVVVALTGDGRRRAEASMRSLLDRHRPAVWIGAGLAGAATPGIPAGTVLVGAAGAAAGDPWAARVLAGGGALGARFLTVDRIAATPREKARLAATAPETAVVAIDLETSGWLAGAVAGGVPGLVVRVVSDSAEEEIPAFVAAASSEDGVDRGRIAVHALTHPSAIGKLLGMRRRARFCAERLADFVEGLARRGFERT